MSIEFFFLGLDRIGTSIAMALADTDLEITRVGYDPQGKIARQARDAGVIHRLESHPRNAPKTADVVILDVPVSDVSDYLEMLAKNLQPDGIVIDCTPLRTDATQIAAELLPEDRHYIGASPVVGPEALQSQEADAKEANANLFRDGLMALCVPPQTSERAVTVALNLCTILGASPFFLDPGEHDGFVAAIEGLPQIIHAALMQHANKSQNWREIQRMAGEILLSATNLLPDEDTTELVSVLHLNRKNLVAKLDAFIEELYSLRGLISEDDKDAIENYIGDAISAKAAWLSAREKGDWVSQDLKPADTLTIRGFLGSLFGIRPRKSDTES
jgi:prephenate dehydrogenase